MKELHSLLTDAVSMGLSDKSVIELMVLEGLPRDACPEILRVFKETV
jgi:hypothetical protein